MIRRYSRYNHRALTEQEERNIEENLQKLSELVYEETILYICIHGLVLCPNGHTLKKARMEIGNAQESNIQEARICFKAIGNEKRAFAVVRKAISEAIEDINMYAGKDTVNHYYSKMIEWIA